MNWWAVAIYGAAALIALQGLLSLMTAHRQASLRRSYEAEVRRMQQQRPSTSEPATANKGRNSKAG